MKHLNLPIPDDLHKKLKLHCVEKGIKMTDLVRELIQKHLEKGEKGKPTK
jgi:hypothetical protein